jgi:signal transduction histidine kinase/CheY-like chemotaxis protein
MLNSKVKRAIPFLMFFWFIVVAVSLVWNLKIISNSTENSAKVQTSAFFDQIQIMRAWNAKHGGVYVKIDSTIKPNPYLDIPNRDLVVDSIGLELTLINPAFMTRLVANISQEKNKTLFHITSLNPIRPENKANEWETRMLNLFERGTKDTIELLEIYGEKKFVYMKPLIVTNACLKCHEKQGYKLGDIRGGISVSIPATEYIKSETRLKNNIWIVHTIAFILGIIGLVIFKIIFDRYLGWLLKAKKDTEKQKDIASKAQDKAELANRHKSEFLANMSHEIRTPLNGVIGFTEILMQGKLTDEQNEQLEIIRVSGDNLLSLINDIIDYSKIEANQLLIEKTAINLTDTVLEAVKMMTLRTNEKGLDLKLDIHPDTPIWILGDPVRIKQIILNYTNNAIKFTSNGFVSIDIYPVETKNNKVKIRFDVIDTGIGISKENHHKMFKTFSQAEISTTRKFGGSGLGLAISKKLAALMGGDVGFESEKGEGSTFWFTGVFKLTKAEVKSEILTSLDIKFDKIKVLLVEDNLINQKVAQAHFSSMGLKILIANNGAEAVEIYTDNDIDMIFMDIQMPVMDGYHASTKIRELESENKTKKRVKIIAMTANAMKGEKEKCIGFGMDDYLPKPFKASDLKEVIKKNI